MVIKGFTPGAFDLLHAGHVLMLKEAKEVCTHLTVLLQRDPSIDRPTKNKPIESVLERLVKLEGSKYVDEIILYDNEVDLYELLKNGNWDLRIIGADYKGKSFTGDDLEYPVYYNKRDHDYSTTNLRKRIENEKTI